MNLKFQWSAHLARYPLTAGFIWLSWTSAWAAVDQAKLPAAATRPVDFVRDIKPIFATSCYSCHGPEKQKSSYRLDVKTVALKGGELGPAILPGRSAESPLIHYVADLVPDRLMPSKGERRSLTQIGLLRAWIDQGAHWPEGAIRISPDNQ